MTDDLSDVKEGRFECEWCHIIYEKEECHKTQPDGFVNIAGRSASEMEVDPVQHWAMIERDRKKAFKEAIAKVYETYGITEKGFEQLHDEALAELQATKTDSVDSEEWTIQVIPDKPIQYKQATERGGVLYPAFKKKLKLSLKER